MASKRSRTTFEADLQARQSPYVFYGTPLPPLDPNVRDDGSYVPVWKQEVTDERRRKRLHGAFTGGFSAGYILLLFLKPIQILIDPQLLQHCRLKGRMGTLDFCLLKVESMEGRRGKEGAKGRRLHG